MKVIKLKSSKHADLLLIGDEAGPSVITVATRVKPTDHGVFFKELVAKAVPEALKALDREIREGVHNSPREASRNVATGVVHFCEDLTMAALDTLQNNKALAVSVPSYGALAAKLHGLDVSQDQDSADVIALFSGQEKDRHDS